MERVKVKVEKHDRRAIKSDSDTEDSESTSSGSDSESEMSSEGSSLEALVGSDSDSSERDTDASDESYREVSWEPRGNGKNRERKIDSLKREIGILEERISKKRQKSWRNGRDNLLVEMVNGMRKVNWGVKKDEGSIGN
jgi:hypothetical protein